ncbi:M3 family oligoendopeptidase [Taibaiella sp. KBW10]|uniref:M3 family oligoendopeptidase n=1 Tax=Taibaiella sp. KBW10 TaxID=2153357 RepID=UPI000F5A1D6C|nr:M3 family oligoendopeptidase [Taibaiella sp. KBW10]RQO31331.1 M3 family oligoendopeptidase [Taibaiella sp. KBW10]
MPSDANIQPAKRLFLPEQFEVTTWEAIAPYFTTLIDTSIESKEQLESWLQQWSELEAVISEDACWRQIRMTCDTTDPALEEAFNYFCLEIEPKLKSYTNTLQQKLVASPFTKLLDQEVYFPFLRQVENALSLYREENVALEAQLSVLQQQYGVISSKMTVVVKEQTYTLQQAAKFLQEPDRELRKNVFTAVNERRLEDRKVLDELFDQLLALRHQVALNAGFDNYRDYKFKALGRFDYTPEDCYQFHEAIKKHILPLQERLLEHRRKHLGLSELKPYDVDAVAEGEQPLKPFHNGQEMLEKSIQVFNQLGPYFGECLLVMQQKKRLDLDSRIGKAPGGYNCPLAETGVPFIFMNAVGTINDVITMMHEGGHAIHSFQSHHLPLSSFKEYPMEIAELASMSMELFSMDYWETFLPDADDLLKAKQEELERVIDVLPWIATIDKFQHWLYTHPGHSVAARTDAWKAIFNEFAPANIDRSGLEPYFEANWQKQLHLFEVPFYYIEYGIAQLGAVAMWRQYKGNKEETLERYLNALSLGYTKTLPQLYETAGIKFSFDADYIKELKAFMELELTKVGL